MVKEPFYPERTVERLTELKNLVMEISRVNDLDNLCALVIQESKSLFEADSAAIIINTGQNDKQFQVISTESGEMLPFEAEDDSVWMRILQTGQSKSTSDPFSMDPQKKTSMRSGDPKIKSMIAIPITVESEVVGVLAVINKTTGAFTLDDEDCLKTIGNHTGYSYKNIQSHLASKRRLEELSTLVEISQSISTSLDQHVLFEKIASKLFETTGVDEFSISVWNRKKDQVVTLMNTAPVVSPWLEDPGTAYPLADYPVTRKVLETRSASVIRLSDPDADLMEKQLLSSRNRSAVVIIPLVYRNESTGIIEIFLVDDDAAISRKLRLFEGIANQIAAVMENARLFEETKRHAEDLERHVNERTSQLESLYEQQSELAKSEVAQRRLAETLREAGAIAAASLDLNRTIDELLNQLSRVVPHDSASVQLLEENELRIVGGDGWVIEKSMLDYRFPVPGPNPNTAVIAEKRPIILNTSELKQYPEFGLATHGNIQSWLGVPLIAHDTVIGMLTLDSGKPDFFDRQQADVSIAFADQVAVAIEQAILYEKTRAALNERDALRAITADITAELDLSKLLESVLVRACELLDGGSGEIGLYRPQTRTIEIVATHKMGTGFVNNHIPLGKGAIGWSAEHLEARIIDNYTDWENALPAYDTHAWHAVMTVPLTYHKRLVGVIAIADKRTEKSFTLSDLELFKMFAHQASIAIENAQLFSQVQHLATTDDLTGLPNRRELFRIGEYLFTEARAEFLPLSAIMIDIDLFKLVNDSHGHIIGDQVLIGLAEIFKPHIRGNDLLGRYGGEEFTMLLPRTDYNTALQIAERLRKAIENQPIRTDKGPIQITLSFGVATLTEQHGNIATLVDAADDAMYAAKKQGRNRVAGFINRHEEIVSDE